MRRILDASQRAFEEALDTIPDGVYSERLFNEVSMTGDRGTYPVQTTVTKTGRTLTFDNAGTAPQAGAINVGFAAWRGSILGSINVLLLADQMGCVGGAARALPLRAGAGHDHLPGLGRCREPGGVYATETAISTGNSVITKMMLASSDETIRNRGLSRTAPSGAATSWRGPTSAATYYVGGMGDNMLGATGACWHRDGEFANGHYWIPEGRGPNVELYERDWPILYLYRREHARLRRRRALPLGQRRRDRLRAARRRVPRSGLYTTEGNPEDDGHLRAATRRSSCARG